jgi:glycosyltransferase involved in cell wall biosynthesis
MNLPLRVGLNLLYLIPGEVGGTETYAKGLLGGLARIDQDDEFVVFVNQEGANWELPALSNVLRVICPVWAINRARRYFFEQVHLPRLLKHYRIDVVHSLGYVAPLFSPCPSVVTIHDLNYRAFGDRMSAPRRMALAFFVEQSAQRASHVIAVSEYARGQILSALGISPAKVTATLSAPFSAGSAVVELDSVLAEHGIDKPYIIAFSSSSPNKNIPRLISAFSQARQAYSLPHRLVLVGHRPPNQVSDGLNSVVSTGYLDEPSKQTLLSGAEMLVFPSTYEGFGLPVLEAQQVGVPVLSSTAASLPEVAGEAAVFFDPLSVDAMAEAIGRVAQDPGLRIALREKGYQNVGRFSWEQTARQTYQIYRSVVDHSTSGSSLAK